jgi:hypothetical protein
MVNSKQIYANQIVTTLFLQLKDVLFFIMLFSIFLFSFGVAIQSLVYPHNEFSFTILYEALHSPFFDMLGNTLTLERVGGALKYFGFVYLIK